MTSMAVSDSHLAHQTTDFRAKIDTLSRKATAFQGECGTDES